MPGKSGESELYQRVTSTDPDEVMPPRKSGKTLTAASDRAAEEVDRPGAHVEQALGVRAASAPAAPAVQARALAAKPDRRASSSPGSSRRSLSRRPRPTGPR